MLSGGVPGPHRIQGIGAGFVPAVLNRELIDEVIPVSDDDAIHTAWACARRAGVLAGISCGAALWRALQVAARAESAGKRIVAIMPDSGERYVSQAFFCSLRGLGRRYAVCMLARVAKEMRRDIAAARPAIPLRGGWGRPEILATWPGIHALLAHRVAHALHEAGVPLLPRAIALCRAPLTGIEIHPAAHIGAGPVHRPRRRCRHRRDRGHRQ